MSDPTLDSILESIFRHDTGRWCDCRDEEPIDEGLGGSCRDLPPEGFYDNDQVGVSLPDGATAAHWVPHEAESLEECIEQIRQEVSTTIEAAGKWGSKEWEAKVAGTTGAPWGQACETIAAIPGFLVDLGNALRAAKLPIPSVARARTFIRFGESVEEAVRLVREFPAG